MLDTMFIGSTTDRVIRNAECAVLSVSLLAGEKI
jgi:nucleotide-binding universal stress UspA family protein